MTYQLSDYAREMDFRTWKTIGGCGLPNNTQALVGPETKLREIESQCPYTARALARYAAEHLHMREFFQ